MWAMRSTKKVLTAPAVIIACLIVVILYLVYHTASIQVESHTLRYPAPLDSVRRSCGELCDTTRKGTPGPFFDHVTTNIDCDAIFASKHIDRSLESSAPPKTIPDILLQEYTMNGRLPVESMYYNHQKMGDTITTPLWSEELIENLVSLAKQGNLSGAYHASVTNTLRHALPHAPGIPNGRVLVIGSQSPWVEACVLEAGAREVVTLEYGQIISKHPKITTLRPMEFRSRFLTNSLGAFDAVVSFSSVEHSGLGRYGDALNPWGDLLTIAKAWCVTRAGGSLTIAVPYDYDRDRIVFNAHRVYGKIRYPYLTTNWKQLYRGTGWQSVHVFTR